LSCVGVSGLKEILGFLTIWTIQSTIARKRELLLVILRANQKHVDAMRAWLDAV
jgi:hypothetical protein